MSADPERATVEAIGCHSIQVKPCTCVCIHLLMTGRDGSKITALAKQKPEGV